MTDVFPRRNLPDDGKGHSAEPWGREVEKRIVGAESSLETLQQSFSGQNRNTASSLGDLATQASNLARQVQDLAGRVGYWNSSTLSQTWTNPATTPYVWGPTITFTLTESRVVSIQTAITGTASVVASNNTTAAFAYLEGAIFVNGAVQPGARGVISTNVSNQISTNNSGGTIISRSLVSLNAGTYTAQTGFFQRNAEVIGTPAAGAASVRAENPNIFIDVLQPAG